MTAQHPAAPETDVSALTETERGWLDEWRDRCDADSTLMRHEGYVELLDDILRYRLVATRERLRVVEGEREAAVASIEGWADDAAGWKSDALAIKADLDALRAGIEALADEWAATPVDEDPWAFEKANTLRALLPGDGR